jgi:hypothetical protein
LLPALGKLAAVRPLGFRPSGLYFLPRPVHLLVPESVPVSSLTRLHCRFSFVRSVATSIEVAQGENLDELCWSQRANSVPDKQTAFHAENESLP